jgi:hypothetical protein
MNDVREDGEDQTSRSIADFRRRSGRNDPLISRRDGLTHSKAMGVRLCGLRSRAREELEEHEKQEYETRAWRSKPVPSSLTGFKESLDLASEPLLIPKGQPLVPHLAGRRANTAR